MSEERRADGGKALDGRRGTRGKGIGLAVPDMARQTGERWDVMSIRMV